MSIKTRLNKKVLALGFWILFGLWILSFQVQAQSGGNASLSLTKDPATGLFILSMRDADGIRSFSLQFQNGKLPYGGDLSGCPTSRKIDNVLISEPDDFLPPIKARVTDCRQGETEFEISLTEDKRVRVKKIEAEAPQEPAPVPTPAPQAPSSEPAPKALTPEELSYPIAELGGCASQESCRNYCEGTENIEKCVAFAEAKGLITREEAEKGRKFAQIIKQKGGGPGGCKTEAECENYCNDVGRIDECLKFAEENGFLGADELAEAKKIQALIKGGKTLPGGCRNKTACEAYCKNPGHMEECVAFAREAGFMSEEEFREVEKILPLMKSGQMPGGCTSKEECEAYCEEEGNFEECLAFAEKAGLVRPEELEIMRKTGGKGPGGCKGRQCQAFCENPANQEVCFEFAKEHGLLKEEDLKRAEEGMKFMRESLKDAEPGVRECVEKIIGAPGISGLEPGKNLAFSGPEIGEKMRECMEAMLPEEMRGKFKFEGAGFEGPGGCKSREECEAYCRSNPEACGIEMPPRPPEGDFGEGGMPPEEFHPPEGFSPPAGMMRPLEGMMPPEGFKPPEGLAPEVQQEYQKQYEEQYRQQYEEQYKQQYQQQFPPPEFQPGILIAPFLQLLR